MASIYRYFRVTGRGGFKWGRHLAPDYILRTVLSDEELPEYLEEATELEWINQDRRRRGVKTLEALPPKEESKKSEAEASADSREADRDHVIQKACSFLKNAEDWTESGRPRVSSVNEVLARWGKPLTTAAEIQSAAPEMRKPGVSGGLG